MDCPSTWKIERYHYGYLEPSEHAHLQQHIQNCECCSKILSELQEPFSLPPLWEETEAQSPIKASTDNGLQIEPTKSIDKKPPSVISQRPGWSFWNWFSYAGATCMAGLLIFLWMGPTKNKDLNEIFPTPKRDLKKSKKIKPTRKRIKIQPRKKARTAPSKHRGRIKGRSNKGTTPRSFPKRVRPVSKRTPGKARLKGTHSWAVYVQHHESLEIHKAKEKQALHVRDTIRFQFDLSKPLYTMVVSLNQRGEISLYLPYPQRQARLLNKGAHRLPRDKAIPLDEYTGSELFIAVGHTKAFTFSQVKNKLKALYQKCQGQLQNCKKLEGFTWQKLLLLKKVDGPPTQR